MSHLHAPRWARAAMTVAALVPISLATTVGAAYAVDELAPDSETVLVEAAPEAVETPVYAPEPEQPDPAVVQSPAEATERPEPSPEQLVADPTPQPEGLASTNDPTDPEETPPTTSADYPAPSTPTWNGWRPGPVVVTLEASAVRPAGIESIEWRLDGAQIESDSHHGTSTTVTISAEGITTLTYFAVDTLDQVSEQKTIEFKIDSTAPTMTVLAPSESGTYFAGDELTFDFPTDDAHMRTVYVKFLDTNVVKYDTNTVVLTEGVHPLRFYALDEAGNETVREFSITVLPAALPDTTPPTLTAVPSSPLNGEWSNSIDNTLRIEATDASGIQRIETRQVTPGYVGPWSTVTTASAISVKFFISGFYPNEYRAIDTAGNASDPVAFRWLADYEAPTIQITSPANQVVSLAASAPITQGAVVDLEFDCDDAVSGVDSCSGPATLATAALGEQTVEVVAVDRAGNRRVQELSYTVVAAAPGGNPGGNPGGTPGGTPGVVQTGYGVLASTGGEIWVGLLLVAGLLAGGATVLVTARARR